MKFLIRRRLKSVLAVLLAVQLFLGSATPVWAGLFSTPSLPSSSSMFSDMEKRYHLDPEAIQSQGETLNVADGKKPVPEVSLFFSPSDPKPGEKVSARAFPMYFSNEQSSLYYTWYLKRKECDLKKNVTDSDILALCDRDNDKDITIEDWKIEAMTAIAQNGFDTADAGGYVSDTDDDGYKAHFGGSNKTSTPDHCYVNDSTSGKNYELLSDDADDLTFDCPAGTAPRCLVGEGQIDPGTIDPASSSDSFAFSDADTCQVSGFPTCSNAGTAACSVGTPRCIADPTTSTSCGTALTTCSGSASTNTICRHLFPNAPGYTTGDGVFGAGEEKAWRTNPNDPDTADNGNKDEANITGLGQGTFSWNYFSGDQVGVAVEGTSMINTKYDDSTSMIMWAFPKKDCPISLGSGTGEIVKKIRGYDVKIPTVKMDLNKCVERNLVDPAQGGQATNLELSVTATPDNPINDTSTDESGDIVSAQVSISNLSRNSTDTLFDWEVEISNNVQFTNGGTFITSNITKDLQNYNLLGNTKGIALDTLRLRLDIPNDNSKLLGGKKLESYLNNGAGYLRFTVKGSESFASGITRKGKSDVVVKFVSTGAKISAYKVQAAPSGDVMHVALPDLTKKDINGKVIGLICDGNPSDPNDPDKLDRTACRVIKNEVIGLRIDPTNLSDFKWTINGVPLNCTKATVSPNCADKTDTPNEVNFFPVSGEVGDTYTVTVTASDLSTTKSDKTVTLTRTFHVVKPELSIASMDLNTAWPKLLGQYKDVGGKTCSNGVCPEYSETVLEGFSGESLALKGVFMPNFLASNSTRQWTVDGASVAESGNIVGGAIAFAALKSAPEVYNVALQASVVQPQEIRQALRDIWNISPLDSPEIHFSTSVQVELKEPGFAQGTLPGSKKYLAAIASYIPASVMFLFRIILSVFLVLFTANILNTLLPERAILSRTSFRR